MTPPPNQTTPPDKNAERIKQTVTMITKVLSWLGSIALMLGLISFVIAAGVGIYQLGLIFKLHWVYALIVALGSISLVVGHAGQVIRSSANIQRLLHGLGLLTWIAMTLFFTALYFAAMSMGVTPGMDDAQITAKLADSFLPADILDTGRQLYSYAVAIGLVTALVAWVVSYAMAHPLADKLHKSLGEGFAPMALNIVTGLIVLTSALHVLNYGIEFAGVSPLEAVAACVVAELTFIAAEQMCLKEIKTREKTGRMDGFDLWAWGALAVIALAYMVIINGVYGEMAKIVATYPDHDSGVAAAHALTNGGVYGVAKSLYPASAPIFGGLLVVLKIVTTSVNVNAGRKKVEDETHDQERQDERRRDRRQERKTVFNSDHETEDDGGPK